MSEFRLGDEVVDDQGRKCKIQAIKEDGKKLSLLTMDGKHAFDADASSIQAVRTKGGPQRSRSGAGLRPNPLEENPPDVLPENPPGTEKEKKEEDKEEDLPVISEDDEPDADSRYRL